MLRMIVVMTIHLLMILMMRHNQVMIRVLQLIVKMIIHLLMTLMMSQSRPNKIRDILKRSQLHNNQYNGQLRSNLPNNNLSNNNNPPTNSNLPTNNSLHTNNNLLTSNNQRDSNLSNRSLNNSNLHKVMRDALNQRIAKQILKRRRRFRRT